MPDTEHAIHLLVSIARIDSAVSAARRGLEAIPAKVAVIDRRIAEIDAARAAAEEKLEVLERERRELEAGIRDRETAMTSLKNKLMSVNNNKEYQAMLKEIEAVQGEVERNEERLLELFDEIEQAGPKLREELDRIGGERGQIEKQKAGLTERAAELDAEIVRLLDDKPWLMADLDTRVRGRYERVLSRHGDTGVVNVDAEHCGGCGTQLPPQVAVEVRKNNQILTCQSCGRILVAFE